MDSVATLDKLAGTIAESLRCVRVQIGGDAE